MSKLPLFVYSELKDAKRPDDMMARGELRRRDDSTGDGAAKFSGDANGVVYGQLYTGKDNGKLRHDELPEYKRRVIRLLDGTRAEAFEYVGSAASWARFKRIPSGIWRPK